MINPLKIPSGVANIMMLNDCIKIGIQQDWVHRPDKLIEEVAPMPSMNLELLDNYVSNTSPISLKKNSSYYLMDNLFKEYFSYV